MENLRNDALEDNNGEIVCSLPQPCKNLENASDNNHPECVKKFLELGHNINEGYSLINCMNHENGGCLDLLLIEGVNLEIVKNGITVLGYASGNGNIEIVKKLINRGAKIDSRCPFTPIFVAIANGRGNVLKILLNEKPKYCLNSALRFAKYTLEEKKDKDEETCYDILVRQ